LKKKIADLEKEKADQAIAAAKAEAEAKS